MGYTYKVIFHLVCYAKSYNCSSCLEGVALEVLKESCYCCWFYRIDVFLKSESLFLVFF